MFFWIFAVIFLSIFTLGFGQMLGPTDFIYKSAEPCPNAPQGITFELSGRKVNRTAFGITVHVDSPYDFDDNLGIELMGSAKKDGGYKPGAFVLRDSNACTTMEKLLGDVFEDLKRQANVDGCPIRKGNFIAENFVINNDNFKVPQVYGDYRMEIKLMYKGEPQSCLLAYYDLVPKNKIG